MKLKYIYTLLTLIIALYFVPAHAQTKKPVKKATTKAATKKVKKPAAKTPAPKKTTAPAKKTATAASKNLGDAAAKATADTTKKGGGKDNNPDSGGSLSEEIVVTTAYKPVLADAVKIRRNPDLEDKVPFKAPLVYAPLDKRQEQNSEIRQLEAMKRPPEQDSILENNYVKAGIGNLKTFFGEAYFANGRDEALQVGGYLKHFSQSGSLEKQSQSRDDVGVFGKSILGDNNISGRITYNRLGTNFYGYDQSQAPDASFIPGKQHFNTIGAEAELAKNYKDVENDFTYALKVKGYAFSNAYQARENNFVISGFLNQTVKQFYAGLSASLDINSQKDSLYSISNNIVRLNPYIKFQGTNYKIDAGVNIVKEFGEFGKFYIFPAAKLEVQVVPKYVRLFVEAKGDVNRSSLRDFANINPFIGQNIDIKNSVDQLDISAGLKGTLAPGLSFKAAVFRNSIKNMPLFVSNFDTEVNKFKVIYDDGKARVTGFNGELDFKASDDFNIFGRVEVKDYKMATEAQPWNLPKFLLTAGTTIHIDDKISVTGSLMFRGATNDRVFAIAPGGGNSVMVQKPIASFADVSGGVEYKATKKISVFVQANNILNTGYSNWLYYPNYGFNIFGGVGYSF
ncbi:TonB-dependent receptor [Mucilaginibacter sabulilitoris]|uniref:TonB-dependent receptor n=1 Tax=Mucilaginibacter sabulilitoris TaxID=1173583 RepID=A0ABZ0TWY6_9SPHI|nr:TonB-dependent receptor [Mucilaginibacter sabulilitoris]WPU95990.1 TonB-dependent receptor [Mucilaginibacter sabulilitoris]